jgi:type II secretory pathway pseudopilin PulG
MRRARGFTLKELLIVVGAIGIIDCLLLMAIPPGKPRPSNQVQSARYYMISLKNAVETYKTTFGAYPPDSDPSGSLNVSELLYKNLCLPVTKNGTTFGPFFYGGTSRDNNGNGAQELASYLGGNYEYRILRKPDGTPRGFLLIDPGEDLKLGGKIDPLKGFVPDKVSSDPNVITEDKDNIYSNVNYEDE